MKQSNSPSDGLWSQCVVGKPHDPKDDNWNVTEVISNGSGRTYCIDGCSTPPWIVKTLYQTGVFIIEDKDNPTGYATSSSFYNGCKSHDICYQTCDKTSQATCDANLLKANLAACTTIPVNHTTEIPRKFGDPKKVNTRDKCVDAAKAMNFGLAPRSGDDVGGGGANAFKKRRQQMCQCC